MKKLLLACILTSTLWAAVDPPRNVVIYKEPGRFGGWPANNGIWVWGNEIVVGFIQGYFKDNAQGHAIDGQKPEVARFARSKDGGLTWSMEVPSFLDAEGKEQEGSECPGGLDFTAPDSAVALRMVSSSKGYSRFYYSKDRARTWQGPYRLPTYDRKGIAARTDYIVDGKHELTAFITASKENGREGRVLCIRTKDGGKTWNLVSSIGPEPQGFSIMPSSVRLSPSRILTTIRRKEGPEHFIDAWVTNDNGNNWEYLNRPVASTGGSVGNPPSMIKLRDGRLVITYGYRSAPYGIRAKVSGDEGRTWGPEIVLRDDAGTWDLGYPRTVQRADGKIVTAYYYNDRKDSERYIGATVWSADWIPQTSEARNVVVYQEDGRFGGWPANHGIWSWGDEILVGFEVGYFRANEHGHSIDYSRPAEHVLARSLDGGETWKIEKPEGLRPPPGEKVAGVPTGEAGRPLQDCRGGVDFSNPNFILTARMTSINDGVSRYHYSMDRGKSWEGPCRLPDFGQPGIAARTDYLINGKHDMTMFLTAAKTNRKEGRVICVRTQDGGATWKFVSYVTPEPEGNEYAIMPASVRLDAKTILTTVRYRKFIDSYISKDDGGTWERLGQPAPETGGNPPSLVKLGDQRLALIYGKRVEPFGIRARLSIDDGRTWSEERVLRQDGGSWDLGYVRSVKRSDGKVVSVYYYNTKEHPERFIGATIWTP